MSRSRATLQKIVDDIGSTKQAHDVAIKGLKEAVKRVARYYTTLLTESVPKSKTTYYKKAATEKDETDRHSQKGYKSAKETDALEHAYRSAVVHLEEARIRLNEVAENVRLEYVKIQSERLVCIQRVFVELGELNSNSHARVGTQINAMVAATKEIDIEKDLQNGMQGFLTAWPEWPEVYFEHFKNKLQAKDMVFGVPLQYALKYTESVPLLLRYCFDAIENRGLDKEGIYRVSGKRAEFNDLRILVETDLQSIDFMDEQLDINLLAQLVKTYLKDLPAPLFLFPAKERAEYSSNPNIDERIHLLTLRVKSLPKEKMAVLQALLDHLEKVVQECSVNKMTIPNLAMIFSGVLFQNQTELLPDITTTNNWFKKDAVPDLNALEAFKNDIVMEDLITFANPIFASKSRVPSSSALNRSATRSTEQLVPTIVIESSIPPTLPTRQASPTKLSLLAEMEIAQKAPINSVKAETSASEGRKSERKINLNASLDSFQSAYSTEQEAIDDIKAKS